MISGTEWNDRTHIAKSIYMYLTGLRLEIIHVVAHFMYDEKENGRDWFRILFMMHEKDDENCLH